MKTLLGIAFALIATAAQAKDYVVVLPANLSPPVQDEVGGFIGSLYAALQPKDTVTVFDASHLRRIGLITMPETIGTGRRDRIKALGPAAGVISDFISTPDTSAKPDILNIPAALREVGATVLPGLHKPSVILIGSTVWDSQKDGTFTTETLLPSDGFLNERGGAFGLVGEEKLLAGARVSFCYTDQSFLSERFRQQITAFWGKSIAGRGAAVGGIEAYGPGCVSLLQSETVDPTPYTIDRSAKPFLQSQHLATVEVK